MVIADTSSLISLGETNNIKLIKDVFGDLRIAHAVWNELKSYNNPYFDKNWISYLEEFVLNIHALNYLKLIMDYGESESVILYNELGADYLLIDDQKAREIAESLNVNCIGSIGLLVTAKKKGLLQDLKPTFKRWIDLERYFSTQLLNKILSENDEKSL